MQKKTKTADMEEAGGRWCAQHSDNSQCQGDRKDVSIDGTRYVMCRKGRNELRAHRAAMTKAFRAAHMVLPL